MLVARKRKHVGTISIDVAVVDKLIPDAYAYEDRIEKLQYQVKLQSEMIAKLISRLAITSLLTKDAVEDMLNYNYEIEKG